MTRDGSGRPRTGGPRRRALVEGEASGPVLFLQEPLSFWGGLDPTTGRVIDPHHPQHGSLVSGTVLVMPAGRGSSSSSSVLAEAIRLGTGPAAIVLGEPDPIVVLGAMIAEELYGVRAPVALVDRQAVASLRGAATASVRATRGGVALDLAARDPSR